MGNTKEIIFAKLMENSQEMSISRLIEYSKEFRTEYPKSPKRPYLDRQNHNSVEAFEHAKKLEVYEKEMVIYREEKNKYQENDSIVDAALKEFFMEFSGANRLLNETQRPKAWDKAWDRGHSSGWFSVYTELEEIIDLFE